MSEVYQLIEEIKEARIKGSTEVAVRTAKAILADAEGFVRPSLDVTLKQEASRWGRDIIRARPSQVTLRNGVKNTLMKVEKLDDENDAKVLECIRSNVEFFLKTLDSAKMRIAHHGANLIRDGDCILTHSYSSMIKAVFKVAKEEFCTDFRVIVTETRPRYQGMKMARELVELGIPTTVIVDSAARSMMKDIDTVMVGADTVSSDGSVITKVGSSQLALVAHEARVPFYVAAPTFKFSEDTLSGVMVKIEKGDPAEIYRGSVLEDIAGDPNLTFLNPSFDATPPEYVRGIITERYVMSPFSIGEFIARQYGFEE